jgi:hypothetical protein
MAPDAVVPFALNPNDQIVQIDITLREIQGLRDPNPGIEEEASNNMRPRHIASLCLEPEDAIDLLPGESAQDLLFSFQVWEFRVLSPPREIRLNAGEVRVD